MITDESFLKRLRSIFNLNIYEVKIWVALLGRGSSTAGELADISNVPRSRSYDILESLEKRGFIIMKLGKPIRYIAVQPAEVLKRVKDGVKKKSEEQIRLLEKVRADSVFKEMELLFKQGISHVEPSHFSGVIRGRTNLRNHFEHICTNAEKSVSIMTTTTGFLRKMDSLKKLGRKLDGVKIRIVAPLNEEGKKLTREMRDIEVKNTDSINSRFVLIDDKEIMFMVDNDANVHDAYDIGIWANSPLFVGAMKKMFDNIWGGIRSE